MRFSSPLILAGVISSSAAFAPFVLTSGPPTATRTSSAAVRLDAERGTRLQPILPRVNLPSSADTPESIIWHFTYERLQQFVKPATPIISGAMIGKPKSDITFTTVTRNLFLDTQNTRAQIPNASEYKFFGNGNHATNLEYLVKTNLLMTAALTERGRSGFEIRAFDKEDPKAEDPSATLFRQIISCLGGSNRRVNIRFDSDMSIDEIRVYEDITGSRIKKIKRRDEEFDYWASSALFNLSYYASCVHANIHILHYILTAALDESSRDFGAMNEWAKFYATNIPDTYEQVGEFLIRDQPTDLSRLIGSLKGLVPFSPEDTYALLTGPNGFGVNGDKLPPILLKLLNMWTNDPTNYLGNMMNVSKEKLLKAGVLTEFMKHHDMVPNYARDVAEALTNTDDDKFGIAEDRLKAYLNRCSGITSGIDSLENWIELMAVTGIAHGATLSYSRLFADADILRWRTSTDTWQISDAHILLTLIGTMCGMDEHRHVMSSSTDVVGEEYDEKLQTVLETYEQKSDALKEAYKNQIMENMDEFNNYGWILSDFCPDGFDGKQLTVASYI